MTDGISLRDFFAGQALIGQMSFKRSTIGSETAWAAYKMADAMLARREKDGRLRDHEIETLTRRAQTAELKLAVIQEAIGNALSEIYRLLGAENHAQAVAAIEILRAQAND
jgi:hypothetical protein